MFSSYNQSATELTTLLSCLFVITFHIRLRSTVANISNIPVDISWSKTSRPQQPTGRRVPRRRGDFRCLLPLTPLHLQPHLDRNVREWNKKSCNWPSTHRRCRIVDFIVANKYQVTTLLEAVPSGFTQPADSTGVGILKVFQPLKLF